MVISGIVGDTLSIPPANVTTTAHFFNFCNTPAVFAPNFGCTPAYWLPGLAVVGTPALGAHFTATGYGRPPAFYITAISFSP